MIGRIGIINLPILPGITLQSTGLPPSHSSVQRLLKQPDLVDNLLMERLSDYLGTLSLNVKILENGENAEGGAQGDNGTGRKKDKGGGAILAAGMMSAGTVLAVKLAALAAISGKALMAALMAMMLAAIAALSKGGGEDHKTTYEIVAKPVVSHSHTHSSEIQHGHGHYKRSLDGAHRMAYARQLS
uniref:Uncharacterized protein n=2 Tax=Rhodnius prolixus TaxID=13249 RepID=T1HBR3_RHOPR